MQYGPMYLQLVNTVLTRLREAEVNSVSATTYSKLIGDLVNQSKREVENAWKWQDLRREFPVSTTAADFTYSLADTDERLQMLSVWNETRNHEVGKLTWFGMQARKMAPIVETGAPSLWTGDGQDNNGAYQVLVHPTPDAVYALTFYAWAPQPDLGSDDDRMYCPSRPVIELALARALAERGEDGGQGSLNQFALYNVVLSDAIAIDANQHPEDIVWRAV